MLMLPVQWILCKSLNHLLQCLLGVPLGAFVSGNCGSNSEFFKWQMSINDARCTVLPSFLASTITHFYFWLSSAAMPVFSQVFFFTFFLHYCLCIWYFHCLKHRNKFVQQIVVTQWIHPFSYNMLFIILEMRSFHAFPHRFIGFNNTGSSVE